MVMAIHQYCITCDAKTLHHNSKCTICQERERRIARAKWLALTPDEKIEILLERIEKLEANPVRY